MPEEEFKFEIIFLYFKKALVKNSFENSKELLNAKCCDLCKYDFELTIRNRREIVSILELFFLDFKINEKKTVLKVQQL